VIAGSADLQKQLKPIAGSANPNQNRFSVSAAAAMQSGYAGVSVPFGISDSNPAVPITAVQMRVLQSFDALNPPLNFLTLDQDKFPGMVRWVILFSLMGLRLSQ